MLLFEDSKVATVWNEYIEQWYFSVSDVIALLTSSIDPQTYLRNLK
ncbi:MAG: hypothetical protein ACKVJP_03020 [Flavobacteriales bacterium]|jgi:hypothetical protein|tara:strand:- start:1377 stop:1514 length:138 start_codon:yes stop_codon:yes gene_type:complete